MRICSLMLLAVCMGAAADPAPRHAAVDVVAEETVYEFVPPDNGSGPMWSSGCTPILRLGDTVIISKMDTGPGVPRLSNTRWVLLKRTPEGWVEMAGAGVYRQREPTALAMTSPVDLYLNVNDSLAPVGAEYQACRPHLIHFELGKREAAGLPLFPQWADAPYFTDHSYRGYAADPGRGELLMLNIDAHTGVQHAVLLNTAGETLATDHIEFPVRACYPQVSLRGRSAQVLAVGDIVEPVEAWRQYKHEQTGQAWDYVFRILYYTETPDITRERFSPPIEITNVDATAGHVFNRDLWVSPEGAAYILYTQREVQSAMMRDRFFPDKNIVDSLYLAVVRDGAVTHREVLVEGTETQQPGDARFHEAPDGHLLVFYYVAGEGGGHRIRQLIPQQAAGEPVAVPLDLLGGSFLLSNTRAGAAPTTTLDIFGPGPQGQMVYAQVELKPGAGGGNKGAGG